MLSHVHLFVTPWTVAFHVIFQARILEWVAISSFRGYSWPKDRSHLSCISCIGRWILYHWATWEVPNRLRCFKIFHFLQCWICLIGKIINWVSYHNEIRKKREEKIKKGKICSGACNILWAQWWNPVSCRKERKNTPSFFLEISPGLNIKFNLAWIESIPWYGSVNK